MTKSQHQRIKKLIDKLEDEVLENGEDITSPEFGLLVEKIIADRGFDVSEYNEMENPKEEPEEIKLKII